jgi:ADP-heptose:LPS heptosyltransferase
MNQILIVNLRRFGDIYTTSHFINSLTQKYPYSQISLLVYEEFSAVAKTLKGVTRVHTIDRKEIITLRKNQLFSNAFALETLKDSLSDIKQTHWDHIVNYSNDRVSTYLMSYLASSAEELTGVRISENGRVQTSSDWDIVFNDVLTTYPHTPLHFVDCYHHMTNTPVAREGEKLNTNPKYNEVAFKNITNIRKVKTVGDIPVNLIGIQICASNRDKEIHDESLKDLISTLLEREEYEPILLVAPIEAEKNRADRLNRLFHNQLIVIESDFQALPSVLMNIDAVVTPDTSVMHAADILDTPVVEVSNGESPFLKQGIYRNGIIITEKIDNRMKGNHVFSDDPSMLIKGNDIMIALDHLILGRNIHSEDVTPQVTMYTPSIDNLGVRYDVLAGGLNSNCEISKTMARYLISEFFAMSDSEQILSHLKSSYADEFEAWSTSEKKAITSTTKALLKTLRSLLGHRNKSFKANDFIAALNILLHKCDQEYIVAIPLIMFRAKLENIEAVALEDNIREVEALLHELKNDIQKVFTTICSAEEYINGHVTDEVPVQQQSSTVEV